MDRGKAAVLLTASYTTSLTSHFLTSLCVPRRIHQATSTVNTLFTVIPPPLSPQLIALLRAVLLVMAYWVGRSRSSLYIWFTTAGTTAFLMVKIFFYSFSDSSQ